MDRVTRTDLLNTVSDQKDQLDQYESKLRSLVSAYKGLLNEKEALQSTVNILSSGNDRRREKKDEKNATKEIQSEDGFEDPLNANHAEGGDDDTQVLRDQVATLTSSVSTVMAEKSKMETNYQAEKKSLKLEHQEVVYKLKSELNEAQNKCETHESKTQELKTRIRNQQCEREKEQNDHAVMLRELQKLVANERMAKEQLEHQLEDTREILADKERQPDVSEQYEKKISQLSLELNDVRKRLKESENCASKPSPLLLELQKEMASIKANHRISVQQEQMRANEAEVTLHQLAQHSESRVSSLESKLSELSDVVGNYEKLRYQDQTAIQRLKERVTQLDLENTALARAAHGVPDNQRDENEANMDVQTLVDKMMRLKGLLKLANERSERPVNIEELFKSDTEQMCLDDDETHRKCQEELKQLKEEFERYKLRAQSVLKNKSSKDVVSTKETEILRTQIADLKERIRNLKLSEQDDELEHKNVVEGLRQSIAKLGAAHKAEVSGLEAGYKQRSSELESQLHKHRDRTIALLAEKDTEIETLKLQTGLASPGVDAGIYGLDGRSGGGETAVDGPERGVVTELLRHTSPGGGVQGEGALLFYTQEHSRKEIEMNTLRKQKHQAEQTLRELQMSISSKEEHYGDQIEFLREEIRRLERGKNRESANLEYLKNVVFRYMICNQTQGKFQMLNAISTILQFSPKEKHKVVEYLNSWFGVDYNSVPGATKI